MEDADLVLELVDGSQPSTGRLAEDGHLVINKVDLGEDSGWEKSDGMRISATEGKGLDELRKFVADSLAGEPEGLSGGALIAINARHQNCLERAASALAEAREMLASGEEPEFVSLPLREALEGVGEVAGRIDTDEILGSIFSQFCIGK